MTECKGGSGLPPADGVAVKQLVFDHCRLPPEALPSPLIFAPTRTAHSSGKGEGCRMAGSRKRKEGRGHTSSRDQRVDSELILLYIGLFYLLHTESTQREILLCLSQCRVILHVD